MSTLIDIIVSERDDVRNQSLESICRDASLEQLLQHCASLDQFRRSEDNLYHRVRALFFLSALYRYHIPPRLSASQSGLVPFAGYEHLLSRRFVEAIDVFLETQAKIGRAHV